MAPQCPKPLPSFLKDLTDEAAEQLNGGCLYHGLPYGQYPVYGYRQTYAYNAPVLASTSETPSFQSAAQRLDDFLFS